MFITILALLVSCFTLACTTQVNRLDSSLAREEAAVVCFYDNSFKPTHCDGVALEGSTFALEIPPGKTSFDGEGKVSWGNYVFIGKEAFFEYNFQKGRTYNVSAAVKNDTEIKAYIMVIRIHDFEIEYTDKDPYKAKGKVVKFDQLKLLREIELPIFFPYK